MCVTTSERAVMMRQGSEKATRGRVRTPKVRRLPDENRTGLFRSFFARSALECDASSHRFWAYRLQRWIGFSEDDGRQTAEGANISAPKAFGDFWQRVEDNAFHHLRTERRVDRLLPWRTGASAKVA